MCLCFLSLDDLCPHLLENEFGFIKQDLDFSRHSFKVWKQKDDSQACILDTKMWYIFWDKASLQVWAQAEICASILKNGLHFAKRNQEHSNVAKIVRLTCFAKIYWNHAKN